MEQFGKDITEIAVLIIAVAIISIIIGNSSGFATDVSSVGKVYDQALSTAYQPAMHSSSSSSGLDLGNVYGGGGGGDYPMVR